MRSGRSKIVRSPQSTVHRKHKKLWTMDYGLWTKKRGWSSVIILLSSFFILHSSFFFLSGCSLAPKKERVVKISILPVYAPYIISKKYSPLIDYLSKETGYKIERVASLSYGNYLSTLAGAKVDIGFQNSLIYIMLNKTKGAYPLVKVLSPAGKAGDRGIIITHEDSKINSISDLRGKRVMIVSRKAVAGYLAQASLCKDEGIDLDKDLNIIVGRWEDEVVLKVYQGKVDAGFVREDALQKLKGRINIEKIKIVAYTKYFPSWCFAAFSTTDKEVAKKIKQALLRLDNKEILEKAEISSFVPAKDCDYDPVRKTAKRLNIPY